MQIFGRLSWFATFLIPAVIGIGIAIWGLNSDLPRVYFVVGFLFALVLLPGIMILLKVLGTPLEEEEVVLLAAGSGDRIKVVQTNGSHEVVSHMGIKKALLTGELTTGTRLKLVRRGDLVIKWEIIP